MMLILQQPGGGPRTRSQAFLPTALPCQPCEGATLEAAPPAPVKPSNDAAPSQHLDCHLSRDHKPEPSS